MMQAQDIPVALCRASPTARPIQDIKVEILAQSIKLVGLRQPINVRAVEGGFEIRGGGHRHAAFVKLGRETIPAFVRDDDDLRAELAEIDENLVRNDLTPIERDIAIARRKAIYEVLHPETVVGATGKGRPKVRQNGEANEAAPRFTKSTADATGQGERTIQRSVGRVAAIGEENLSRIVNTPLNNAVELDALAQLTPERRINVIERVTAGEDVSARTEFNRQRREERLDEIVAAGAVAPMPAGRKFNIIYADPPWRFDVWSQETGLEKSPENHYPTMTVEEICDLPVSEIVADDALLFMWITAPRLYRAEEIFRAWGPIVCDDPVYGRIRKPWTYVTHVVWDKERIATGYWNRNRHELLLIAKVGDVPRPLPNDLDASVYREASTVHSAKPVYYAEWIEKHYPGLPKIELFRRGEQRPGWDAWGNESEPSRVADDGSPTDPDTGEILDAPSALSETTPAPAPFEYPEIPDDLRRTA